VELITGFIDVVLHLDQYLQGFATNYGHWIYLVLFLVIFCETGLVVTPFLPGDSLLFVAGAVAAGGSMYVHTLFAVLVLASFLGDNTNYWIGRFVGPRIFGRESSRWLKPQHLQRTHEFYAKHGGKTVLIARFVPIVRTFAPFVAGMGHMVYPRFLAYSFGGAVLWIGSLVFAGYFFGNLPFVQQNLSLVIVGIILISLAPGAIEIARGRSRASSRRT
jgi:membrane-associated protein